MRLGYSLSLEPVLSSVTPSIKPSHLSGTPVEIWSITGDYILTFPTEKAAADWFGCSVSRIGDYLDNGNVFVDEFILRPLIYLLIKF